MLNRNIWQKSCAILILLTPVFVLLLTINLLFFQADVSRTQTEECHVFGAVYMTMNNPYFKVLDNKMHTIIENEGDVLISRDSAMSQERQNEEIRELIKSGVELIFIACVDWDKVEEGIQYAQDAGVPVIAIDTDVRNKDLVTCSVVSDNYHAGELCAEHLLANRDSANILLLEHITSISGRMRIMGFTDTIKDHPAFRIVGSGESDGQIENAMPVMEILLKEHPEANVVMALNDPSAFGAMAAIEGAGLSGEFLVYGVDGSPEARTMIADHLMTATVTQFPSMIAARATEVAYQTVNGQECEKEIIIPVELISSENVDQYNVSGWQ